MSRRCRIIVYSIAVLGIDGGCVAHSLIKLLFFSGLFVPTLELIGSRTSCEINMNETYQDPGARSTYRFMDNRAHMHR